MTGKGKRRQIFISTGKHKHLAIIGQPNVFSQFYYYAVGYLHAGNTIIEKALDNDDVHKKSEYMYSEKLSECAIPACFLYRQYLEITLKDIYLQYSYDDDEIKKSVIKNSSHDLNTIWTYAKPVIETAIHYDDEKEELKVLENYINQFAEEDPSSFKYRYPIEKNLKEVHQEERKINLKNLMDSMNKVEEIISKFMAGLDVEKDINRLKALKIKS